MVTKQQQLEWLAKECDKWPVNGEYFTMNRYAVGACVHAHVITREEWQQERDKMQKQQDNSWYERGDLPPVGCECEFVEFSEGDLSRGVSSGDAVEILAHYSPCSDDVSVAVFSYKVNSDRKIGRLVDQAVSSCFRPLRTEREKAIDEMAKLIGVECQPSPINIGSKRAAEILYDAGYRKQ